MIKFVAVIFTLIAALANAATLDVFVPLITDPIAGTVWKVGTQRNVSWDTSNAPRQVTNGEGLVTLAQGGVIFENQPGGLQDPLASGFDILLGQIPVTVPDVPAGNNYQVVLFGDSGNFSPEFTIEQ